MRYMGIKSYNADFKKKKKFHQFEDATTLKNSNT